MQSFLSAGVKFHRVFSGWWLFFALLLEVGHFRPIRSGLPEAVDRKTTKRNEKIMPPHGCSLAAARPPCQVVFVSTPDHRVPSNSREHSLGRFPGHSSRWGEYSEVI